MKERKIQKGQGDKSISCQLGLRKLRMSKGCPENACPKANQGFKNV
jgi:hypothetical protein